MLPYSEGQREWMHRYRARSQVTPSDIADRLQWQYQVASLVSQSSQNQTKKTGNYTSSAAKSDIRITLALLSSSGQRQFPYLPVRVVAHEWGKKKILIGLLLDQPHRSALRRKVGDDRLICNVLEAIS